jgi:hypothetical protein
VGLRGRGLGFGVWGLGLRVEGLKCMVYSARGRCSAPYKRVGGSACRVQGIRKTKGRERDEGSTSVRCPVRGRCSVWRSRGSAASTANV